MFNSKYLKNSPSGLQTFSRGLNKSDTGYLPVKSKPETEIVSAAILAKNRFLAFSSFFITGRMGIFGNSYGNR